MSRRHIPSKGTLWISMDEFKRDPSEHNYVIKIAMLEEKGMLPSVGLFNLHIFHDNWCGIYDGRNCNCDCEI